MVGSGTMRYWRLVDSRKVTGHHVPVCSPSPGPAWQHSGTLSCSRVYRAGGGLHRQVGVLTPPYISPRKRAAESSRPQRSGRHEEGRAQARRGQGGALHRKCWQRGRAPDGSGEAQRVRQHTGRSAEVPEVGVRSPSPAKGTQD